MRCFPETIEGNGAAAAETIEGNGAAAAEAIEGNGAAAADEVLTGAARDFGAAWR